MDHSEKIIEISNNSSHKIKVKGSQFISYAFRVDSVESAQLELQTLKKEYYDATHHCFAYKLNDGNEKYSDDGEPNGTAGIRILNSITHFNLTNLLVVVVRYFGGTKLGIGPLGKAYGDAALQLLSKSKKIELTRYDEIQISFNYDNVSTIHYFINKYKCKNIQNIYDGNPEIKCCIEPFLLEQFREDIVNKTNGNAKIRKLTGKIYSRLK